MIGMLVAMLLLAQPEQEPEQVESSEPMEEMVEGVVALCDCDRDVTGQILVSLDIIDDWKLTVHNLDGTPRSD